MFPLDYTNIKTIEFKTCKTNDTVCPEFSTVINTQDALCVGTHIYADVYIDYLSCFIWKQL